MRILDVSSLCVSYAGQLIIKCYSSSVYLILQMVHILFHGVGVFILMASIFKGWEISY